MAYRAEMAAARQQALIGRDGLLLDPRVKAAVADAIGREPMEAVQGIVV